MKHIFVSVLALAAAVFGVFSASAQSLDTRAVTDGGLSLSHASSWTADTSALMTINLTDPDGWRISVSADVAADYSFLAQPNQPPAETIGYFVDFMLGTGATLTMPEPVAIEIAIIAAFRQDIVNHLGVPIEVIAFNLANGTAVLAMVGNQQTNEPVTPKIRDMFHRVAMSVAFDPQDDSSTTASPDGTDTTDDVYVPEGATLISDLAPNTLYFAAGVETSYPEGWVIYSDSPYIQNYATLLYGTDIFNYTSMVNITVYDSIDMSMEIYREGLLPFSAMIYTGNETFDAERDIIREELPDGSVLEYLNIPEDAPITGNLYMRSLDSRYWASIMFTNLSLENAETRIEEVRSIIAEMVLVRSGESAEYDGHRFPIIEATCDTVITSGEISQSVPYAAYNCPSGCTGEYAVWGSDIYTLDSTACASAIHAGAITEAGGLILVTWTEGQESYTGEERNGITTMSYTAWGESFTVIPLPDGE